MEYIIEENKIIIPEPNDFNIKHICDCGQMFRYEDKITNFTVKSSKYEAIVYENDKKSAIIESKNIKYYEKYFDLATDYGIIKSELVKTPILEKAISFGSGIRIAKQDLLEMIVSFIISANNNISRIKRTINQLCESFGEWCENYFAFPTLQALKEVTKSDFEKFGCGYRSQYLVDTIANLSFEKLENLKNSDDRIAKAELLGMKGVGEKVADCIMLFGLSRKKVFPVDVWMSRVCDDYFDLKGKSRPQKSKLMCEKFGNLSGYAQQYLFYYKREMKEK